MRLHLSADAFSILALGPHQLTRHGKKLAVVRSTDAAEFVPDLEKWIGSGKGTFTFGPNMTL